MDPSAERDAFVEAVPCKFQGRQETSSQALEHCCGRLGGKEPPLIGSSEVRPDDVERLPTEGLDIDEMMATPLL